MAVAQRGQPKALVVAGVGGIADPDHGVVEQPDHGSNDALLRQAVTTQIGIDLAPNLGQAFGKSDQARKFGAVAFLRPLRMVAILLAAALVPSGCLNVTIRIRRNPHIRPGWRNDDRLDPRNRPVGRRAPVWAFVGKTVAGLEATDARLGIGDISKRGSVG